MTLDNYTPGLGNANEYTVSAYPWVTSSVALGIVQFGFPFVTRFVTVKNVTGNTSNVTVGFTRLGIVSSSNYYTLAPGESYTGEFKLSKIFVSGSGATVNVIAGYTAIQNSKLLEITGSNGYQGVG